ncbi:MAG: precorrin-2 dehydrogenase/sirohydrochlorin ferrochelatase family protein [Candidatus Helarchaeota archaeon]
MLPVGLNLKGKKILIIGGGNICQRRVIKFIHCNAKITIISYQFTNKIQELAAHNPNITLIKEEVNEKSVIKYLDNQFLVSIVTDNPKLNLKIAKTIKKHKILINLAHHSDLEDISIPATIDYGDFIISIFTYGKAPIFAKRMKEKIQNLITKSDINWLNILIFARELGHKTYPTAELRTSFLNALLDDPELSRLIEKGHLEEAKSLILRKLENS